jgi:GH15 family glucan-1,4-alpha-glucosidase
VPLPIEDYALLGDTETAALVGRDGSIDWLCLPRFDSGACFAALLGGPEHGRWLLAPADRILASARSYRDNTLVLDQEFTTAEGVARVTDCMPLRKRHPDLVRLVEGLEGEVRMRMELVLRFDYGCIVPWVRATPTGIVAIAGPDAVRVSASVPLHGEGFTTVAEFTVRRGERVRFALVWHAAFDDAPEAIDVDTSIEETERWWREWSGRCTYEGPYGLQVRRSLMVLKALTYAPSGGLVAAPTTSLPESPGGVRNWDYRYCWLRDSTMALYALVLGGYLEEAAAWRDWLLRAVAGDPRRLQIMYGLGGERRLPEFEVRWLPGYNGARPVRIGNAAVSQLQLDVYGEVIDTVYQARRAGMPPDHWAWQLGIKLLEGLETLWRLPDEGIWEVRGPSRHFTHSKVLSWVAFDRGVKAVEHYGLKGPVERWRRLRDVIHADVCEHAFDPTQHAFVQAYGTSALDASVLLIPLVGFLPPSDPRVAGTVAAIERGLMRDGFVMRYDTATPAPPPSSDAHPTTDGLPPGEGAFLACSFWLADNYVLLGRYDDAERLFERLVGLSNDVGLLAEEYDPRLGCQLGNFPQAFSHLSLVNTAHNLSRQRTRPATDRSK